MARQSPAAPPPHTSPPPHPPSLGGGAGGGAGRAGVAGGGLGSLEELPVGDRGLGQPGKWGRLQGHRGRATLGWGTPASGRCVMETYSLQQGCLPARQQWRRQQPTQVGKPAAAPAAPALAMQYEAPSHARGVGPQQETSPHTCAQSAFLHGVTWGAGMGSCVHVHPTPTAGRWEPWRLRAGRSSAGGAGGELCMQGVCVGGVSEAAVPGSSLLAAHPTTQARASATGQLRRRCWPKPGVPAARPGCLGLGYASSRPLCEGGHSQPSLKAGGREE